MVVVLREPAPSPLVPLPYWEVPELYEQMEPRRSMLDTARWAWIAEARASLHDTDPPEPEPKQLPDVWPELPGAEPWSVWAWMLIISPIMLAGFTVWRVIELRRFGSVYRRGERVGY